jgi:hypothetical protein
MLIRIEHAIFQIHFHMQVTFKKKIKISKLEAWQTREK